MEERKTLARVLGGRKKNFSPCLVGEKEKEMEKEKKRGEERRETT